MHSLFTEVFQLRFCQTLVAQRRPREKEDEEENDAPPAKKTFKVSPQILRYIITNHKISQQMILLSKSWLVYSRIILANVRIMLHLLATSMQRQSCILSWTLQRCANGLLL